MTADRPPLRVVGGWPPGMPRTGPPSPSGQAPSVAASRAAHPSALGPRRSARLRQLGRLAGRALVVGAASQLGRELVYRITR